VRLAPLEESLDADLYGGKAAQLAAAVGAGLPVPRGVALSVELVRAIAAG
jgi:pyruvate,water dikinase